MEEEITDDVNPAEEIWVGFERMLEETPVVEEDVGAVDVSMGFRGVLEEMLVLEEAGVAVDSGTPAHVETWALQNGPGLLPHGLFLKDPPQPSWPSFPSLPQLSDGELWPYDP